MDMLMNLSFSAYITLSAALGLLLGVMLTWLIKRSREAVLEEKLNVMLGELQTQQQLQLRSDSEQKQLKAEFALLQSEYDKASTALAIVTKQHEELAVLKRELDQELGNQREQNAQLAANLASERKQAEEKLAILSEAKERLTIEFKNLANEIFEEKSTRFTEQNRVNLETVLKPLSGQIKDFQKRVEDS